MSGMTVSEPLKSALLLRPAYMPVTTCSASLKVCMASPSGIDDPGSFSRHEVGPTIRTRAAK